MDNLYVCGGALQFASEKDKLICIAQPLREWRTFSYPLPQHRRRLQEADFMPTCTHSRLQHRSVELHTVLAIRQIVAHQQYLHRSATRQIELQSGKVTTATDSTL